MKTTKDCPLKAVLFGKMTSAEACESMRFSCSLDCSTEFDCCVFQFLDFLFFRCKEPEAMLERLQKIVKSAPVSNLN